jgi:hypothetical protein
VQRRLVVGVQVEHQVGIVGEAEQRVAQRRRLADRHCFVEGLAHRRSDRRDVGGGVGPEPAFHCIADNREVRVAAVEVRSGICLVAAAHVALHLLA